MKYSYSRVECFKQCQQKYKYRYVDKLSTLPEQNADNALHLGVGLHRGIETTVEEGVAEYQNHFYVLTDEIINWSLQLEYWIPRVKELLPANGKHEEEVNVGDFIGYIDYLTDDTIYDFKFTVPKNHPRYMESKQLHIYKHYLELQNPNIHIQHLKYIFIPKCNIRQKKTETIQQFRSRLYAEMDKLEIEVVEVKFNNENVSHFIEDCKTLETDTDYHKNVTRLCGWCDYENYCLKGEDYEIMQLPKNERRKVGQVNKRTLWIYGRPFSGKTTLADAAPDPLMLNTDGNVNYVTAPFVSIKDEVKTKGRMIERTFAWEVFKDAITELEKGDNGFKTLVVDLLEDTYEACRLYMYAKLNITHESDDSFRAWDKVRTEYLSTIRRLMNLDYENIILLSHEDATKDITKKSGENITSIKPNINDKCANKIAGMVGLVGRVVVDGEKRTIQFKADDVVFGGGRLNTTETEIPLDWNEVVRVFDEANKKAL